MTDIKSAANDPFILSAMENTYKFENFNKNVQKIREKNKDAYNDINYQDALDLAGFQDYMNGKRDNLGELSYKDYINAPKILEESVQKWAKDFGYHTEWVEGDTNQLIYKNEKKEVLTKNEIINKLASTLDPSLTEQLQINTRFYYKDKPSSEIENDVINFYKKQDSNIESELVKIKAKKVNASEEDKIKLQNDEDRYTKMKKDISDRLDSKNFDFKSEKYNVYINNLFDNIADNYDRDNVVDVKYIDNNLQLAQFQKDVEYKKAVLEQGQQRIDIENKKLGAMNLANKIAQGSVTDRPEEDLSNKTDTQLAEEANKQKYLELKQALENTDNTYNSFDTEEQKNNYIKELVRDKTPVNINTDTLDPVARQKLNDYKATSSTVYNTKVKINKEIGDATQKVYSDILNGKATLGNLAITMPITAKYVKNKTAFSNLNKRDKVLLMHEIATNMKQYGSLSDEENHTLDIYIKNLESQDFLSKKDKERMVNKSKEDINLFKNASTGIWERVKGVGKLVLSGLNELPGAVTGDSGYTVSGMLSNDIEGAKKEQQKRYLEAGVNLSESLKSILNISKALTDVLNPMQDTNITELEVGDLNKKAKSDADTTMKRAIITATNYKQNELKKIVPTIKDLRAISFNPEDKNQKEMATAIQTQVASMGGVDIEKGSVYETFLTPDKKGINIRYTPLKGKEKVNIIIPTDVIPELTNSLDDKSGSFYNSKKNVNAIPREFSYKVPEDSEVKRNLLVKLSDSYGESVISKPLLQSLSSSDSSLLSQVQIRAMSKGKSEQVSKEIFDIADSTYKVQWVSTGYSWRAIVRDNSNKIVNIDGKEAIMEVDKDFNEGDMKVLTIDLINKVKTAQLQEILKQD